ncbi:hypothetical protein [Thalassotalea sp. PLHSN55]|uniref:hypothetical protein n=1 Tax=Thalassotalea sp. PLHSN55 TaxID=3435888 RepID=UPI003F84F7C8
MLNDLPMTLSAESKLTDNLHHGKQLLEQLEAWLNFQALKANWFADENKSLTCTFVLLSQQSFQQTVSQIKSLDGQQQAQWTLADHNDFMVKQAPNSRSVKAVLAISEAVLNSKSDDNALLNSELKQTLVAVVNTIATQNQLDNITIE